MPSPEIEGFGAETAAWADSGAMSLTGRMNGPPLTAPGRVATLMMQNLTRVGASAEKRLGHAANLPTVRLLGERAAIAKLSRRGPLSCGGAFRTVPTADGRLGLSLARETDRELIPALVKSDDAYGDEWAAVARWALGQTSAEAESRCAELGLPASAVPFTPLAAQRPPIVVVAGGRRTRMPERPLVVDFSALWAGPLCAHLLGLAGAEVVKVETVDRPDGARFGPPEFFDLLHAHHRSVAIDPRNARSLGSLQALVARADVVVEASRARALAGWGLDAQEVVRAGTTWVTISARGRDTMHVGFGDDIAVGAGLWATDHIENVRSVLPCGDALADPLSGVAAAAAVSDSLESDRAHLIDVSMHDLCREAAVPGAGDPIPCVVHRHDRWWVDTGAALAPVRRPFARPAGDTAPVLGAHTDEILSS